MKRILSLLTALTLTVSSTSYIISCTKETTKDQQKANDIAGRLNGKSIIFKEDGIKTQAKNYTDQIQAGLNSFVKQTKTNYTFIFNETSGDTILTTTDQDIKISIKVGSATSIPTCTIKVKFSDYSDQHKANDIANTLTDASISFKQDDLKTKASDYTTEIQKALEAKVPQTTPNYSFDFKDKAEGDKTLTTTEQNIIINIKVGSTATSACTIKVKFSDNSDQHKVNAIKKAIDNQDITLANEGKTHKDYSIQEFKSEIKTSITKKVNNTDITSSYDISFDKKGENNIIEC